MIVFIRLFIIASCLMMPMELLSHELYDGISIINLIATPERFHEKKVSVAGWLSFGLENMSLCLSEDVVSSKECIWVEIDESSSQKEDQEIINKMKQYNGQPVLLHGIFDQNDTGHLGGWSGAIGKITHVASMRKIKFETPQKRKLR